jgi:dolichol-phosphate mannosyltransferase
MAHTITVVVPTFREAESLPSLLDRLSALRATRALALDVIIVDDNSRDGSDEVVRSRGADWVQLIVRTEDRGLSSAVLRGFQAATGDVLVCMDADLSHPPEAIPDLVAALDAGADFAVGSRYVAGGSTADEWTLFRRINSLVATWMARPLTNVKDPMAGFFALTRKTFESAAPLNAVGYKIGLELIVKCRCRQVVEVPIHFENRQFGQSKLSLRQQGLYLLHLARLYSFKLKG